MRLPTVLAGFLLFIGSISSANDWPGFRGPNRNDISEEKGLLKKWPDEGPKLAWKCEGIGIGFSSVAVVGKRVFTIGDRKDSSFVFCIDRDSGEKLWSTKLGQPGGNYAGTRLYTLCRFRVRLRSGAVWRSGLLECRGWLGTVAKEPQNGFQRFRRRLELHRISTGRW